VTESIEQLMARLRAEYLAEIPERLDQMLRALDGELPVEQGIAITLPQLFHRLAGSAGAYGYGEVTRCCRDAERLLQATPTDPEPIRVLIEEIREAFGRPPTEPSIEQS